MISIVTAKSRTIQPTTNVTAAVLAAGQVTLTVSAGATYVAGDLVVANSLGGLSSLSGLVLAVLTGGTTSVVVSLVGTQGGTYTSGGTLQHVGHAATAVVDSVAVAAGTVQSNFTLKLRLESLAGVSTPSARLCFFDASLGAAVNGTLINPGLGSPLGPAKTAYGKFADPATSIAIQQNSYVQLSIKQEEVADAALAASSGQAVIAAVLVASGPGTTFTYSAWAE
jgi:hypothetical protein